MAGTAKRAWKLRKSHCWKQLTAICIFSLTVAFLHSWFYRGVPCSHCQRQLHVVRWQVWQGFGHRRRWQESQPLGSREGLLHNGKEHFHFLTLHAHPPALVVKWNPPLFETQDATNIQPTPESNFVEGCSFHPCEINPQESLTSGKGGKNGPFPPRGP